MAWLVAGLGNPGPNWSVVGIADFNGDGKDDILLQDKNTGNLMIDLMNGTSIASTSAFAAATAAASLPRTTIWLLKRPSLNDG